MALFGLGKKDASVDSDDGASRNKLVFILALAFGAMAAIGVLVILGGATDRVTYHVLKADVSARTQLLPSMLKARTVSAGGQPENALSPEDLASGQYFATVPLLAGDVVTESVAGEIARITDTLPEDYMAVSIQVDPEDAVAGKVRVGDVINIFGVRDGDVGREARLVLQGVQVLDVTTDPSTIVKGATSDLEPSQQPGPESNAVRGGIPYLYVVALSPTDVARLALVRGDDLLIALANAAVDKPLEGIVVSESDVYSNNPASPNSGGGLDGEAPDGDLNAVTPTPDELRP